MPEWLCAIVARLQEKSPADRFASARDVSALLARCEEYVRQPHAVPLPEELRELTHRYFPPVANVPPAPALVAVDAAPSPRTWLGFAAGVFVILMLLAGLYLQLRVGTENSADRSRRPCRSSPRARVWWPWR